MRLYSSPETWILGALTAFFLAATILLAGPDAHAGDVTADKPMCTCPSTGEKAKSPEIR